MSIESIVISHVVRHGEEALNYLLDHGITASYFTEELTRESFTWLLNEWSDNGEMPSQEKFGRRFNTFEIVVEPDSLASLVRELRNHYAMVIAAAEAPSIIAEFKDRHTFDLVTVRRMLGDLLERLDIVTNVNETALLSVLFPTYLKELFAMDGTELPGIPTGFPTLDAASGGWQPENFGVIGAAPKRFKTAILLWMALAAVRARKRIKLVTFEMSIKELTDRIVCLGAEVSYTHIMRGTLSKQEKRSLTEFNDEFQSWGGDIEIVHDVAAATTLGGLAAMLRTGERPDMLMIDGLYQMTDDSREWSNETAALTAVSRGVKRLAANEQIAIVGTTQALQSRITRARGTEMDSLGYTRAWAQDANVVIGIDRNDMQSTEAVLKVVGARSMAGVSITITVDLDTGTIYEGGPVGGGDAGDVDY